MLGDMMRGELSSWVKEVGPDQDVVLSSRARLARNLSSAPFPNRADDHQLRAVLTAVSAAMGGVPGVGLRVVELSGIAPLERQILVEKHLASPDLTRDARSRAIATNAEETVSVMVNEEDHLRIQAILPGLQLGNALDLANRVDDGLQGSLQYAFCEVTGYLTACPTNAGTGLRASVMMHLPALTATNQIGALLQNVSHLGLAVRGLFGEGSAATGGVYQVSNQVTLGLREDEIVSNLTGVTRQIVGHEREARRSLVEGLRLRLEDRVWRAYGVLKEARVLPTREAAALLSDVRLGIDVGLVPGVGPSIFNELLVAVQPAFLQKMMGRDMDADERDSARATLVRERLREGIAQSA